MLHGVLHPDGDRFSFEWDWLAPSGLHVKDFICPSSFRFGEARRFQMGGKFGAVSFLQITAPEMNDRLLADLLDTDSTILVSLHIRSMDQNEAIKTVKRKITDLDSMKTVSYTHLNPGNQRDYEPVHFQLAVLPKPKNVFRIWQTKGLGA